jgi:hypothetical protein
LILFFIKNLIRGYILRNWGVLLCHVITLTLINHVSKL